MERLKRRTSYHKKEGAWQIDLTDVTSTSLGSKLPDIKVTTELEFELKNSALQQWLSCPDEEGASHRMTSAIATELREVINACIVQTSEEGMAGANTSNISSISRTPFLHSEIKKLNARIIASTSNSYSADDFLGSMPLNMSRRNLLRLQREEYFVTEKSDGVRYLMYIVPSISSGAATAVFVDRAGSLFRPPGAEAIAAGLKTGTVLDGEIVFNLHYRFSVFLVFDILSNEGESCAHLPFASRMEMIRGAIMSKCGKIDYSSHSSAQTERPMWIIRKKFWPKKDIKQLISHLVSVRGTRVYKESDRRYHKSDGIIFQPNAPYVFGTDVTVVKWKWPELVSVDLQVVPNRRKNVSNEPSLMAEGPDQTLVDCCMRGRSHVGLGKFDTYRLLADVEDSVSRVHIAEVSFCPNVGLWSYFQLREDKTSPNFINTVLCIIMEQAENVDLDELVSRILSS